MLAYATIIGKPLDPPPAPQWATNPSAALAMGLVHDFLLAAQCPSTATVFLTECHKKLQGRDEIAHALVRIAFFNTGEIQHTFLPLFFHRAWKMPTPRYPCSCSCLPPHAQPPMRRPTHRYQC